MRDNLGQAKPTASKKARVCIDGAAESAAEAAHRRGGHRRGVSGSRDHSSTPEDASEGGMAPPRRITRAQEGAKPGMRPAEPRQADCLACIWPMSARCAHASNNGSVGDVQVGAD